MSLAVDIATLRGWIPELARLGHQWLNRTPPAALYLLDFIMFGALKRTMSLAGGLDAVVAARNMVCSRAIVRMHLDTASRLRAYTYVAEPEEVARAVIHGERLDSFKSADGTRLRDAYLIERFSKEFPWAEAVYKATSGYVHFSESQFFDAVQEVDDRGMGTISMLIGPEDSKFPEESWVEVLACFNMLTTVTVQTLESYFSHKR